MSLLDLSLLGDAPFFALLIAVLSVLTVAVSKSGFGGALGALSAPIMLFAFSPKTALAILIPIFIIIDIWVVWHWRKEGVRRIILWMVFWGIVGQIIGWALLRLGAIDDSAILAFIGFIALITALRYYVQQFTNAHNGQLLIQQARLFRRKIVQRASLWCSLSGFTSFVSLSGGIPAQIYLLPLQLPRQLFVATMAWYFLCINLFKIPFFLNLELLNHASLSISALMIVFVPIGVSLGRWLNKIISDKLFYNIAYGCLLVLGCQLLYRYFTIGYVSEGM